MLRTMAITSLYCSVDTLPSTLTSWAIIFIPCRPSLSHNCVTYEKYIICLCDKVVLVKYWYILNLNPLSSLHLTKNQAACRSVGKWRLGVGITWQDISETEHPLMPHRPPGFRSCVFIAIAKSPSLYRWLLKRDDWDPGECTRRYWGDDRSFCWKSNGSKNGLFFWRERSRTGIRGERA